MTVDELLARRLPSRIGGVLGLMRALEEVLPRDDGIAYFLRLYRAVTQAVADATGAGTSYRDPGFLRWLDVVFANLFFRALRDVTRRPASVPKAWAPVVEARGRPGIAPLQFALAGMNAHINRDLPFALAQTWAAQGVEPVRGSPQHRDFTRVNALLEEIEERVRPELSTGPLGQLDEALGDLDDIAAMWKVSRAREAAWVNGETLWALRAAPKLRAEYALALDRLVGLAGRGLLRPLRLDITPVIVRRDSSGSGRGGV